MFSCFKIMSNINNQQPKGKGSSRLDHSWICRNCFLVGFTLPFSHPLAQFKIFSILCPQVVGRCLVSARMLREDHLSLLARERSACLLCSAISRCLHKDRDRCFDHRLFWASTRPSPPQHPLHLPDRNCDGFLKLHFLLQNWPKHSPSFLSHSSEVFNRNLFVEVSSRLRFRG